MTSRRHIAVIPSWYLDGRGAGGGYFRDQALALQAAGHRVAMLVPEIHTLRDLRSGRVAASADRQIRVEHDGIDTYRLARRVVIPRVPFRNALAWSLCGLRLFAAYAARNGRPDLVHAHSALNAGVLAALIKARYGIPFVLTEHSVGFDQQRLRAWERILIRHVAQRAHARLAVSPHLVALLEGNYGRGWMYVPNILGEAFLRPPIAPPPAGGGFTFICAARLSPEKNQALLLRAFAEAFRDDSDVRLALAGDGPSRRDLENLCADLLIAGQVEFRGVQSAEQMRGTMGEADALVLASDAETFGVVVIEAQSLGLPVVATASGGPNHLVDASNGLLVPVGNRAALCAALKEMRHTADRYDRGAIRAIALQEFGPEAFVRQFGTLLP